jgi:hypothetical protein
LRAAEVAAANYVVVLRKSVRRRTYGGRPAGCTGLAGAALQRRFIFSYVRQRTKISSLRANTPVTNASRVSDCEKSASARVGVEPADPSVFSIQIKGEANA